ncbi:hypothetical protein G6F18_002012 [Rhizopus arrhizus]|nr:hypothetical protein G6F18_002012 [Rhizopus arrhizus]
MKSAILFVILLLTLLNHVQAYFYLSSLANSLPFKGMMASAQANSSLYLFGGENATSRYSSDLYKLTQTSDGYTWSILPQTNPPEGTASSQAYVTSDLQNLVVMGGMSKSTVGVVSPLQISSYNFASQTWTSHTNRNQTVGSASFIYNRESFSATYDRSSQTTYVFGGDNSSVVFSSLHKLDANFQVTPLTSAPEARYGHTTSILSSGKLVVLGGVASYGLATMKQVMVYDPSSNAWTQQNVSGFSGMYPSTTADHVAVVNSDDQIIIFGGDSRSVERNRQYLNSIAILDTKTWSWIIPSIGGIPPARRAFAVGGLLDGSHLTGLIAGVTVAGIVLLLIILFLIWKFQSYLRWLVVRIHNDIWKPRTGEPIWAETSRLISQVFFLFIFIMFLYFVIRQAIKSPNVTQRIEYASATVDVPDVRFCFDGFPAQSEIIMNGDNGAPGISCMTDNGYSCTSFIQKLDMSVFQPTFSDSLGAVTCFLFRAPDSFKLTSTSGANNGSRLLFTMFGDLQTTYGRIHLSVYPKNMDPNAKVYNTNDTIPVYMSQADVLNWQTAERNDLQSENVFTIQPSTYSALSYDIVDHRYLQPVGWNYVGFLPITNSTPVIETSFRSEAPNPNYTTTHTDLGLIAVYPSSWATLIDREVKMYTLLNALGFIGGIFSMLIAVQVWLFGFRPRSPWGVVHRWSTGSRKQSLLTGLQSKFKTTDSGIPLVHPVHHRSGEVQETEAQRVSRVEERMQILELLFKSYYVDDEVFRSLDNANKNVGTHDNPFLASSEKIPTGNQNGFSHMFSERQSLASASSDPNAQHLLNTGSDVHLRNDMR